METTKRQTVAVFVPWTRTEDEDVYLGEVRAAMREFYNVDSVEWNADGDVRARAQVWKDPGGWTFDRVASAHAEAAVEMVEDRMEEEE